MRRSSLRVLLFGAFLAALGGVVASLGHRTSLEGVLDMARLTAEDLPELLQRIRSFHRVVTRDGLTLLEVSAEEASYFKNQRAIVIVKPEVVFYEDGKRVGQVSGNQGRLFIEGHDVESVELTGDIVMELETIRLEAESLAYDRARSTIKVDGKATLTSPDLRLTGTDLTVDMVQGTLFVNADVAMRVE